MLPNQKAKNKLFNKFKKLKKEVSLQQIINQPIRAITNNTSKDTGGTSNLNDLEEDIEQLFIEGELNIDLTVQGQVTCTSIVADNLSDAIDDAITARFGSTTVTTSQSYDTAFGDSLFLNGQIGRMSATVVADTSNTAPIVRYLLKSDTSLFQTTFGSDTLDTLAVNPTTAITNDKNPVGFFRYIVMQNSSTVTGTKDEDPAIFTDHIRNASYSQKGTGSSDLIIQSQGDLKLGVETDAKNLQFYTKNLYLNNPIATNDARKLSELDTTDTLVPLVTEFNIKTAGNVTTLKFQVDSGDVLNLTSTKASVVGDIIVSGDIRVSGDIDVSGNINVSGNLNISKNIVISGNLEVLGETTTIETTHLVIEDNMIEVNTASDGTMTSTTAGLNVNRGVGVDDAKIIWDESPDRFELLVGTDYANLKINNLIATGNVNVTNGNIMCSGNVNISGNLEVNGTSSFTTLDMSGGSLTLANDQISGDWIDGGTIGSITISQLAGSMDCNNQTMTNVDINSGNIGGTTIATSDITVGAGKTLNVSAGTLTLANDQISGDKIEGGTIGSITISQLTSSTATFTKINTTGDIHLSGNLITSGSLNTYGDINLNTGNLNLTGNLLISGNLETHNIQVKGDINITGDIKVSGNLHIDEGYFRIKPVAIHTPVNGETIAHNNNSLILLDAGGTEKTDIRLATTTHDGFNLTIINYGEENIVLNSVYSTSNLSTGELTFIAKKAYKFISYDSVWYPLG
jgi:predicted acyltransferase (DUF342 family)